MSEPKANTSLTIVLAPPRGFCAGVVRAINIVGWELAIRKLSLNRPVGTSGIGRFC
jgi:hypothetical protein